MTDIDKALTGLECLITNKVPCEGCPYYGSGYCTKNIAADATELLKGQEETIELLEHDLSITRDMLNFYVNGND